MASVVTIPSQMRTLNNYGVKEIVMPKLKEFKEHTNINEWSNVAALVIDRLDSYENKFDKLIDLNEKAQKQREETNQKLTRLGAKVLIHDILACIFVAVLAYLGIKGN